MCVCVRVCVCVCVCVCLCVCVFARCCFFKYIILESISSYVCVYNECNSNINIFSNYLFDVASCTFPLLTSYYPLN